MANTRNDHNLPAAMESNTDIMMESIDHVNDDPTTEHDKIQEKLDRDVLNGILKDFNGTDAPLLCEVISGCGSMDQNYLNTRKLREFIEDEGKPFECLLNECKKSGIFQWIREYSQCCHCPW